MSNVTIHITAVDLDTCALVDDALARLDDAHRAFALLDGSTQIEGDHLGVDPAEQRRDFTRAYARARQALWLVGERLAGEQ